MTASQIRARIVNERSPDTINIFIAEMLQELAAQLADFNAHAERLEYLAEGVINVNSGGLQVRST